MTFSFNERQKCPSNGSHVCCTFLNGCSPVGVPSYIDKQPNGAWSAVESHLPSGGPAVSAPLWTGVFGVGMSEPNEPTHVSSFACELNSHVVSSRLDELTVLLENFYAQQD